jgi:hypothetical protein
LLANPLVAAIATTRQMDFKTRITDASLSNWSS